MPWGEDPATVLAAERARGSSPQDLEERTVATYLMALRARVNAGGEVASMLASVENGAAEALASVTSEIAVPGTEDLLLKATEILVEETKRQLAAPPATYLVDSVSGRALMPLTEKDIFYPPDFVGEDGKLYKSRPVVHPRITSGIALARAEAHRMEGIRKLAEDPVKGMAYRHITDPVGMVNLIREKLFKIGVGVSENPMHDAEEIEVEFGRENVEADTQSVNPGYHRIAAYSTSAARKVAELAGYGGSAWIGEMTVRKTSKQRWYCIRVQARQA